MFYFVFSQRFPCIVVRFDFLAGLHVTRRGHDKQVKVYGIRLRKGARSRLAFDSASFKARVEQRFQALRWELTDDRLHRIGVERTNLGFFRGGSRDTELLKEMDEEKAKKLEKRYDLDKCFSVGFHGNMESFVETIKRKGPIGVMSPPPVRA